MDPIRQVLYLPASLLSIAWMRTLYKFQLSNHATADVERVFFCAANQMLLDLYAEFGAFIPVNKKLEKHYREWFNGMTCNPSLRLLQQKAASVLGTNVGDIQGPFECSIAKTNFLQIVMLQIHAMGYFYFFNEILTVNKYHTSHINKLALEDQQTVREKCPKVNMFSMEGGYFENPSAKKGERIIRTGDAIKQVLGKPGKNDKKKKRQMSKGMDVAKVKKILQIEHRFYGPDIHGTGRIVLKTKGLDWIKSFVVDFEHPIWHCQETKDALNASISSFSFEEHYHPFVDNRKPHMKQNVFHCLCESEAKATPEKWMHWARFYGILLGPGPRPVIVKQSPKAGLPGGNIADSDDEDVAFVATGGTEDVEMEDIEEVKAQIFNQKTGKEESGGAGKGKGTKRKRASGASPHLESIRPKPVKQDASSIPQQAHLMQKVDKALFDHAYRKYNRKGYYHDAAIYACLTVAKAAGVKFVRAVGALSLCLASKFPATSPAVRNSDNIEKEKFNLLYGNDQVNGITTYEGAIREQTEMAMRKVLKEFLKTAYTHGTIDVDNIAEELKQETDDEGYEDTETIETRREENRTASREFYGQVYGIDSKVARVKVPSHVNFNSLLVKHQEDINRWFLKGKPPLKKTARVQLTPSKKARRSSSNAEQEDDSDSEEEDSDDEDGKPPAKRAKKSVEEEEDGSSSSSSTSSSSSDDNDDKEGKEENEALGKSQKPPKRNFTMLTFDVHDSGDADADDESGENDSEEEDGSDKKKKTTKKKKTKKKQGDSGNDDDDDDDDNDDDEEEKEEKEEEEKEESGSSTES